MNRVELYASYGFAFVILGVIAFMLPPQHGRDPLRHSRWIAAFCLLHGARELLTAELLARSVSTVGAQRVQLALLIFSYAALAEFVRREAREQVPERDVGIASAALRWERLLSPWSTAAVLSVLGLVLVVSTDRMAVGDIAARLLLCLPAGVAGGVLLWRSGRELPLRIFGAALLGYGVLGGMPVMSAPRFAPDWPLTPTRFTETLGVSIELLRTAFALTGAAALVVLARRRVGRFEAALDAAVDEALGHAEGLTRRALETAQTAIAISRTDGALVYVNPAFASIWELAAPEEAIGQHTTSFWTDPDSGRGVMEALMCTGRWAGELNAQTRAGNVKRVQVSATLLRTADGAPNGMLTSFLDSSGVDALSRSLHEERDLSRSLLSVAPAIVVILSLEGRVQMVNRAFEKLTGHSAAAIRGADWFETCIPEQDRVRMRTLFDRATAGQSTRSNENALLRRDGEERIVEWSDALLRDEEGAPRAILAMGIDVTQRVFDQRRPADSERRLRSIVGSDPEYVQVIDPSGRVAEVNSAGLRMLEADAPDEVLGRLAIDFVEPGDRAGVEEMLQAVLSGAESSIRFQTAGLRGGRRWVEQTAVPLRDPASEARILGVLAVAQDITVRREAEQKLRESEARLREAQAIGRLGSWELDLRTQQLTWSAEIYRIFEIDPARFGVSYEAFLQTIHPDDRLAVNAAYTRAVEDRTEYGITHRLQLPDGRVKWVEERARHEFGTDGEPIRSVGTVQDVTAAVRSAQELRESLAEKETLLREIHHRVKNNLQIISSLLHFQAKKVQSAEDARIFNDGRNRLRAMILVHEVLYQSHDLSRVAFGELARTLVAQLAEAHGVTRAGIRPTVTVVGNPQLEVAQAVPIGMLLTELVINAFKYAFPDGRRGEVRVEITMSGSHFGLCVRDDGVGLPGDFDATTTTTFGWQLIRMLVTQLDGHFLIEDGPGTTVRLTFLRQHRADVADASPLEVAA
jgi:PAS domain S-box-containing protein